MMPCVTAIFVTKDADPAADFVMEVITHTTKSRWAHVAIGFEDCIIEASFVGIQKTDMSFYDGTLIMEVFPLFVNEDQYMTMRREAERWVGTKYGFDDCVIGGIVHLFGKETADKFADRFDDPRTKNCSALYAHIIRTVFPNFGDNFDTCEITPQIAYEFTEQLSTELSK